MTVLSHIGGVLVGIALAFCIQAWVWAMGYCFAAGVCQAINKHLRLKIQNNSNVIHKVAE